MRKIHEWVCALGDPALDPALVAMMRAAADARAGATTADPLVRAADAAKRAKVAASDAGIGDAFAEAMDEDDSDESSESGKTTLSEAEDDGMSEYSGDAGSSSSSGSETDIALGDDAEELSDDEPDAEVIDPNAPVSDEPVFVPRKQVAPSYAPIPRADFNMEHANFLAQSKLYLSHALVAQHMIAANIQLGELTETYAMQLRDHPDIDVAYADLEEDIPEGDIPEGDISEEDISAEDLFAKCMPEEDLFEEGIPKEDIPQKDGEVQDRYGVAALRKAVSMRPPSDYTPAQIAAKLARQYKKMSVQAKKTLALKDKILKRDLEKTHKQEAHDPELRLGDNINPNTTLLGEITSVYQNALIPYVGVYSVLSFLFHHHYEQKMKDNACLDVTPECNLKCTETQHGIFEYPGARSEDIIDIAEIANIIWNTIASHTRARATKYAMWTTPGATVPSGDDLRIPHQGGLMQPRVTPNDDGDLALKHGDVIAVHRLAMQWDTFMEHIMHDFPTIGAYAWSGQKSVPPWAIEAYAEPTEKELKQNKVASIDPSNPTYGKFRVVTRVEDAAYGFWGLLQRQKAVFPNTDAYTTLRMPATEHLAEFVRSSVYATPTTKEIRTHHAAHTRLINMRNTILLNPGGDNTGKTTEELIPIHATLVAAVHAEVDALFSAITNTQRRVLKKGGDFAHKKMQTMWMDIARFYGPEHAIAFFTARERARRAMATEPVATKDEETVAYYSTEQSAYAAGAKERYDKLQWGDTLPVDATWWDVQLRSILRRGWNDDISPPYGYIADDGIVTGLPVTEQQRVRGILDIRVPAFDYVKRRKNVAASIARMGAARDSIINPPPMLVRRPSPRTQKKPVKPHVDPPRVKPPARMPAIQRVTRPTKIDLSGAAAAPGAAAAYGVVVPAPAPVAVAPAPHAFVTLNAAFYYNLGEHDGPFTIKYKNMVNAMGTGDRKTTHQNIIDMVSNQIATTGCEPTKAQLDVLTTWFMTRTLIEASEKHLQDTPVGTMRTAVLPGRGVARVRGLAL